MDASVSPESVSVSALHLKPFEKGQQDITDL